LNDPRRSEIWLPPELDPGFAPEAWERFKRKGPVKDPTKKDPLVLDLGGDGIKTTNLAGSKVAFFDLNADGYAEMTGWVAPGEGVLAMDRNGDGRINDGRELFGDQTILKNGKKAANGFEALAELDTNRDGKIDANDAAFSQLRILTTNTTSNGYELHTLDELGVKAINVDSTPTNVVDEQGNTQTRVSSFETIDGTLRQIAEYSFQRNPAYAVPQELLPVPDDIAAMPCLPGSGTVYDLREFGEFGGHNTEFDSR
jgi:hypothetical protein